MTKRNTPDWLVPLFLRIGLAFVFIYAAVSAFRQPAAWTGFVPGFVTHFVAAETFLKLFGIFQLLLAAALLSGRYVRYTASLAALTLAGLLAFNLNSLIITFRDVGLVCMAVALALTDHK